MILSFGWNMAFQSQYTSSTFYEPSFNLGASGWILIFLISHKNLAGTRYPSILRKIYSGWHPVPIGIGRFVWLRTWFLYDGEPDFEILWGGDVVHTAGVGQKRMLTLQITVIWPIISTLSYFPGIVVIIVEICDFIGMKFFYN